jgi:hypothetical protein
MTSDAQRERELLIAKALFKNLGMVATLKLGPDPPDVLACLLDNKIGVEVTEFHTSVLGTARHPRKQVEAQWAHIKKTEYKLRQEHPELREIGVRLRFCSLLVPSNREVCQFIREVYDFVKDNISNVTETLQNFPTTDASGTILPKYVQQITLFRMDGAKMHWCWNHDVTSVGITEEELSCYIKRKADIQKPAGFNELLLVIAGGLELSQYVIIWSVDWLNERKRLTAMMEQTQFDEIHILDEEHFRWTRRWGRWKRIETR